MNTHVQRVNAAPVAVPSGERHLAAIREGGKIDRLNFTDAIKRFIDYVDGEGEGSTRPDLAYSNMTKTVYAAFNLNRKQREALESGLKPRDAFSLLELRFLQLAESAAANIINDGIDANVTRKSIKSMIRNECGYIAGSLRRISKGVFTHKEAA